MVERDIALAERALQRNNITNTLVVAQDGQEALDYLFGEGAHAGRDPSSLPVLVLLDLKLPKIDGLLVLEANVGAPHRTISIDPAVDTASPKARNPALDLYATANGFNPATNSATYSTAFKTRYLAAQHARSQLGALLAFKALAFLCCFQRGGGAGSGYADHTVVVSHDHITGCDQHAGTDDGDID